jgi:hypothetical protein
MIAQFKQITNLTQQFFSGDSRAVLVVGPAGRPDHEHSTAITTIRR